MRTHKEIHFEDEICAGLAAAGSLYDPLEAARYDRTQALLVDEVRAGCALARASCVTAS